MERLGVPADGKEALAFFILAHQAATMAPNNLPAATGAARQVVMGKFVPGRNGFDLLQRLRTKRQGPDKGS